MNCYKHTNEEVFLRCGKCDRPICPRCTRHGPAGARCPECSSLASSPLYQVSTTQIVLGGFAGIGTAFVLGYLMALIGTFGFFQLWGGLLAGGAVGEVILRATQRKRGFKMEILTAICTTAGVGFSCLLWYIRTAQPEMEVGQTFEELIRHHGFYIGAMIIMVFGAVSRVRFF